MDAALPDLLAAWTQEPEPVDEALFTKNAEPGVWHAWNEWSVEVEVADFLPRLAQVIGAVFIVETGVGQGYVTRRLMAMPGQVQVWAYESDDQLREGIRRHLAEEDRFKQRMYLQKADSASAITLSAADLCILDSDMSVRFQEIRAWLEHGKLGSYAFIHDAHPDRDPRTGYRQLWNMAEASGLPMMRFHNPRGSVLLYKDRQPDTIPNIPTSRPKPTTAGKGSVLIAQLDGGTVDGAFAHSMARLTTYTMQFPGMMGGYIRQHSGPRVWHSRDQIVRHFLTATDSDWLLQIDSDMVFRWDLLEKMMASADAELRPIIAGHCYMLRGETGPLPTMWTSNDDGDLIHFEGYPDDGLVPVEATGAAVMLVHRSVFEKLQAFVPDHPYPWYEETVYRGKPIGEDLTFCLRARSHGFPIYVDTSLDVGHNKTVTVDKQFFADWRKVRRTIITGPPGPHLEYVAGVLRRAGVSCGLEWVYKADGTVDWGNRWADASPYPLDPLDWDTYPEPYPTVLVVTHPLALIANVEGNVDGMLAWIARACDRLDHQPIPLLVRAEELSVEDVAAMLQVCRSPGANQHPTKLAQHIADQARPEWKRLSWDDPTVVGLGEQAIHQMRQAATIWGYD